MAEMRIGDRLIGDGHPTYIIAEIGVNHNGMVPLAFELIDKAIDSGVDAVKFQKRNLEKLYPKKMLENVNVGEKNMAYLLPILQQVELSDEDYYRIKEYCDKKGITFICSPFDIDSADFLDNLGVPAFKVASADMINLPLLSHLVKKDKPMIISTGMSRMEEVEFTVDFLREKDADFALLHCNSAYPAAFEDINLSFMNQLRKFGVPVGYSGHERGIAISTVAAAMGANIIERHITLDRTMDGPDHAASLEPHGFAKMVRDIRQVEMALGSGDEKFMSRGEILNREVLAKSLVAARDIKAGEVLTEEMITVKGPGQGLSPQRYKDLVGRTAIRDIEEDDLFLPEDIGTRVTLDMEHTLPMEWGFVVRYNDFEPMLKYNPKILEFHFTDRDLEEEYNGGDHDLGLVVHAPEFWSNHLVDLCTPDDWLRNESVKMLLYDNLADSVERLEYDGVELLLENLPAHPWYFGGQWLTNAFMDVDEIIEFIEPRGLKICFDTSHSKLYCNWANVDFYHQVQKILPYISHLHLADAAGLDGEGMQIREGVIDWVKFFKVAKDYHGTMIPEIWRGHQRGGEGFLIALNRLSDAYYEAVGG